MLVIGLTGSIGMGKSTAAERFRWHGIPVIDADVLVHDLYRGPAVQPVEAAFPGVSIGGQIDRQRLSAFLLAHPGHFAILEAIVHPLVLAAEKNALKAARLAGAKMAVLEIPLLFETGGDARVDVTVVVSAPAEVQRQRVLSRPGMTADKLDAILKRQLSDIEKRNRADYVVDTHGELPTTHAQIDAIIHNLAQTDGDAYTRHWI
jgi:dephospho-CoA kinase